MKQNPKLLHFLSDGPKQAEVANAIGVSKGYMSLLVKGLRGPSLQVAIAIERFTNGAVPASSWEKAS